MAMPTLIWIGLINTIEEYYLLKNNFGNPLLYRGWEMYKVELMDYTVIVEHLLLVYTMFGEMT
jgi:hypothetical protein